MSYRFHGVFKGQWTRGIFAAVSGEMISVPENVHVELRGDWRDSDGYPVPQYCIGGPLEVYLVGEGHMIVSRVNPARPQYPAAPNLPPPEDLEIDEDVAQFLELARKAGLNVQPPGPQYVQDFEAETMDDPEDPLAEPWDLDIDGEMEQLAEYESLDEERAAADEPADESLPEASAEDEETEQQAVT